MRPMIEEGVLKDRARGYAIAANRKKINYFQLSVGYIFRIWIKDEENCCSKFFLFICVFFIY